MKRYQIDINPEISIQVLSRSVKEEDQKLKFDNHSFTKKHIECYQEVNLNGTEIK